MNSVCAYKAFILVIVLAVMETSVHSCPSSPDETTPKPTPPPTTTPPPPRCVTSLDTCVPKSLPCCDYYQTCIEPVPGNGYMCAPANWKVTE